MSDPTSSTRRTAAEIVARIESVKGGDWLATQLGDLVPRLPFEAAKSYLKPEADADAWIVLATPPLDAARDYLPFAWEKANNRRGISAGRSLDHFAAWLWLAGFDNEFVDGFARYRYYGKAWLVTISTILGFDWRAHDDGSWSDNEDAESRMPDAGRDALATEHEKIGRDALARLVGPQ